jgi:SWI/SNF-related matrix-associated actin-dependent regulator of chromatin subfamily A member 5
LLAWLKESQGRTGPSLVICPLSVLSSWCHELTKWAPSLQFFRLHASSQEAQLAQKQELTNNALNYDVIVTTYEMAKVPLLKSLYSRLVFQYVVLDEGHKIKGHETQIAQAVRNIKSGNKLLLTGTPLQNNMVELWSLLNYLYPDVFTTSKPFQLAFNLTENIVDKAFLRRAQKLLDIFMLRRLKSKVETQVPAKLETKVFCPLSKTQVFWYKSLLLKDLSKLEHCQTAIISSNSSQDQKQQQQQQQQQNGGDDNDKSLGATRHSMLRNLFMQLRKCCNHPFLFDGAEVDPNSTSLEDLVAASGKLSVLDMLLQSLCKKGHRAVLFSQFTQVLDIIEDYCKLRGWQFCRFDGTTDRARRNYLIDRFNEPNSPYFLFLVSTRSGGMGLNLQTADTCILFDSDWNPQSDIQAMGRVHRIGQTKTVHVYRLVSAGTVEERMLERAEKKLLLEMVNRESSNTASTNNTDDQDIQVRGLSAKELLDDIQFGSQAVFGASTNNELPSWDDMDAITDRSRTESDSVGRLQGGIAQSAENFDATKTFTNAQHFGGMDFSTIRKEQEARMKAKIPSNLKGIGHLWQEISQLSQKRQRKSRLMHVDGSGSGYGLKSVPILVSNNYELDKGESSVFDRELSHKNKNNFGVTKKKKGRSQHENQGHCQVCGDGGSLVCCSRCPCSVHLKCVGLTRARDFLSCTHHRCAVCHKNRASAGGVLYPCHACSNSYCEDCLPKHEVTYLDEVERFEALNFDSSTHKVVYINCSKVCEKYAKEEYDYIPPSQDSRAQKSPAPLDVSFGFGEDGSLEDEVAKLEENKKEELESSTRGRRAAGRKSASVAPESMKTKVSEAYARWMGSLDKFIEKVNPHSGEVLGVYPTLEAAGESIGRTAASLRSYIIKEPPLHFEGFLWRLSDDSPDSKIFSQQLPTAIATVVPTPSDPMSSGSASLPIAIDCESADDIQSARTHISSPDEASHLARVTPASTTSTTTTVEKAMDPTSPESKPLVTPASLFSRL